MNKQSGPRIIVIAVILTTSFAPNLSPHRVRAIASPLTALERQGSGAAKAGRQAPSPGTQSALAGMLNADGTLDVESAAGGSFDVSGYRMETTGLGTVRFVPEASCGPGTGTWDAQFKLPNGVNGIVRTLTVSGSDLYIGGSFTGAGNVAANNVVRFNTTTGTWSALGSDGNGVLGFAVHTLAVSGNNVYVGGSFSQANFGGTPVAVNNVARFNMLTNTWSALGSDGNGVNGAVYALAVIGSDIYVGGSGTLRQANIGGTIVAVNYIARFNTGSNTWSALGSGGINGVKSEVHALAVMGTDLYVGGGFSVNVGGTGFPANYIAKYNTLTNTWSVLGSGFGNGLNGGVGALAVIGNDLYAGGQFTQANVGGATVAANNIVRYNTLTNAWNALGSDGNGVNGNVRALAVGGNDLFVSGSFTQTNVGGTTVAADRFARFNTTTNIWSAFGTVVREQINGDVEPLAVRGSSLFVGGFFAQAIGGGTPVFANNIARLDTLTNTWSSLGSGSGNGVNGPVDALAVIGTDLYVGGTFTAAGDVIVNDIARFSLTTNTWSKLGSDGNGVGDVFFPEVRALAVMGTDLYVGGLFYQANAGGTAVNCSSIARYDTLTNTWSALGSDGSGVGGYVFALAFSGSDLYVGGSFSDVHLPDTFFDANNIARFNTTTNSWSALGTSTGTNGTIGDIYALAVIGNDVYVGGGFHFLNNHSSLNAIGRYDTLTNTWNKLGVGFGNGVNGSVFGLAVIGSELYLGGTLTRANLDGTIVFANRIVRYNTLTNTWSALGSGGNGLDSFDVRALAVSGSSLYIGGFFTTANVGGATVPANNIVRFDTIANTWTALGSDGNGVNEEASALALSGNDLFVGGLFSKANVGGSGGGTSSVSIGKFTLSSSTSPPPQITCPGNITRVAPAVCPPADSLAVSYPDPTVSCADASVACSPSSGSLFSVGTTTVTCTAIGAGGNSAACSFTVSVFSLSLQDDSNSASAVLFNPSTGEYRYCCNGVVLASGRGAASVRGCAISITHNQGDRRVLIKANTSSRKGTATLQMPAGQVRCTINDRNMANNNCNCS